MKSRNLFEWVWILSGGMFTFVGKSMWEKYVITTLIGVNRLTTCSQEGPFIDTVIHLL